MSTRAIAPVVGASEATVRRDIPRALNDAPATQDVPTFDPDPIEVDHATGEVYRVPTPSPA